MRDARRTVQVLCFWCSSYIRVGPRDRTETTASHCTWIATALADVLRDHQQSHILLREGDHDKYALQLRCFMA